MMAERDLECFLCRQHFTALSGDLIIPEHIICDDCITELEQLEGDALRQCVSQHLAQRDLAGSETEDRIVQRFESGQQDRLVKSMAEMIQEIQRRAQQDTTYPPGEPEKS